MGYIEIHDDGLNWRKVDVDNWDRNRQNLLCQHLGFNEDANITRKNTNSRDIATGDLICYHTQPSGTSCCAYLHPSTTSSRISIPSVNCKFVWGSKDTK